MAMEIKKSLIYFDERLHMLRYSEASIRNYKSVMENLLRLAQEYHTKPEEIDVEHIGKYVHWLVDTKKISASYQRLIVASIDKFYSLALDIHLPIQNLYPTRKEHHMPEHLSKDEIKRMIQATDNIKHTCILELLYSGGLRLSELLNIEISDVNTNTMALRIRMTKANKERKVILSNVLHGDLETYLKVYKPEKYLFEGQQKEQYSAKSVQNVVKSAAQRAEITKHVTPHTLRHSFAIHLLESGTDIHIIQELLGHESVKTTEKYTQMADISKLSIPNPLDTL